MKKYLSIVGAALLAALALSAVGVASASAAEFALEAGKTFPVHFTSKNETGVTPTLRAIDALKVEHVVTCTASSDTGEITGSKSVAKVTVTYTGCKEGTSTCTTSGQASGTIVTKSLSGAVVELSATEKRAGMELKPESGTVFAEFTCSIAVKVEGCTIGEAKPVNEFKSTGELLFEENGAKTGQLWTKAEGGAECTEKAFGGSAWNSDKESESFTSGGLPINVKLVA